MLKQGYGHIINVGSPGFIIGVPLYLPYVCSKAAMCGWTRTIQAEWSGTPVRVSEYFPGYIKTDSPAARLLKLPDEPGRVGCKPAGAASLDCA